MTSPENPFRERNEALKATQREFRLQVACVEHLRSAYPGLLFFHIPNRPGGGTDGYMKKMMGAVAGAPDLVCTWSTQKHGVHVAAIELKAPGGSVSPAQNKMLSALAHRGWKTAVCRSVAELDTQLHIWGQTLTHNGIKEPCYANENDKFAEAFDLYAPHNID